MFKLKNKCALITGGAGLLGIEHARALLEIGAKVVIADISQEKIDQTLEKLCNSFDPDNVHGIKLDVTSEENIIMSIKELDKVGLEIDILINNAAIDSKVTNDGLANSSRLEFFSTDQWDLELSVGLKGAFLCTKHFGKFMAERESGVILNIASDLSVIAPDQRLYKKAGIEDIQQPVKPVTYSIIKSALIGLTKYTASYWADKNIRCNALSPGGVYNSQNDQFISKIKELILMNRMAKSDEYKGAVQFLCSDASSYMTGQNIVIDGGRSVI